MCLMLVDCVCILFLRWKGEKEWLASTYGIGPEAYSFIVKEEKKLILLGLDKNLPRSSTNSITRRLMIFFVDLHFLALSSPDTQP